MILIGVGLYLTGLWLGPHLAFFPLSFLGALLSFGFFLTWLEHRRYIARYAGFILFAILVGGIGHAYWASSQQWEPPFKEKAADFPVTVEGIIAAPVRQTPDGLIILVEITRIGRREEGKAAQGKIRLTWREPGQEFLVYGDRVTFTARLRDPYGTLNPGGFHYGNYLKRKGIQAVATVHGPEAVNQLHVAEQRIPEYILGRVDQWRHTIHRAAVSSLTNPALGLFLGMVLGEQSFIEQDIRDAFMASGTIHILSISGSHLGLLALIIFAAARGSFNFLPAVWLERLSVRLTATRFAILCTLPAVSFYTLLAGAEMATIRSWIMIVVCCVGIWLGRERNLLTALAVAAILMVLPHPEAIHDISFQLSYVSVAAIGLVVLIRKEKGGDPPGGDALSPPVEPTWFLTLWRKISLAWLVTLAVSVTTLPLIAHDFYQIPWLGLLTNMIIVPLVGIFLIPIGLLSGILVLMQGEDVLFLTTANQWLFDLLAQVVVMLSQVPGAVWHVASPHFASMIVFWGFIAGLAAMWHRVFIRWGCAAVLLAILLWWGWSPRTGWKPGTVRVMFLDVGQGDATVLELPDGQTVLIDAGPAYRRLDMGRAVIGPYLWNQGIRKLDHVIATHPQWDHVGGLPYVLQAFEVGHYWSNGISRPEIFFRRLQSAVGAAGLQEQVISAGMDILKAGPCTLVVLNPSKEQTSGFLATSPVSGMDLNNHSLVTRLECGEHSFLLTADAEYGALDALLQIPHGLSARVVKVPHHGAKSSLHREWVNRLQTEAVVISVGARNRYGHPAPEVLEWYQQRDFPLYRTDHDGAIWMTATIGSQEMVITTARQERLFPVQIGSRMWEAETSNWIRFWRGFS